MTPPEAWYEQIVGYIVASRTASWTVAPGRTAKQRIPDEFRRAERSRPSCVLRDGQPAGRKLIAPPYGEPRPDDVEAVVTVDALYNPWPQRDPLTAMGVVVDSNMVVEHDSRRKPFLLRDVPGHAPR